MTKNKRTGVIRRFDNLGRVVVPKEFRKVLNMNENDSVEIRLEGNTVVLKKPEDICMCCGNKVSEKALEIDIHICDECIGKIKNL